MTQYSVDNQLLIQRIEDLVNRVDKLQAQRAAQTPEGGTSNTASIVNLIDNGEIEFSKDAYINAVLAGGDIGFEAYNWYRQDSANSLLIVSAAEALKSVTHSLFAANEGVDLDLPRWDRVNGWGELGGLTTNYSIACPLPVNFVRPGMTFVLQFISKLRTSTAWPDGVEVAMMFHDNTVSQEKVIEGGPFAVTASVPNPGATALEYKIYGRTDYGELIESNVVSVPDAPAILTQSDYVGLSWTGAPGYINFDIYKKAGGIFYLQGEIDNGGTNYRDQGDSPLTTVAGYPATVLDIARAYVETQGFAPTSAWARTEVQIRTPSTYNSALTTGKQWLRIMLTGLTTDVRQLLIDRIGVSTGFGGWARSANDLRAASGIPSTSASSSDQGDIGIIIEQPGGGIQL